ncbi:MAG TPA: hypothetical protein PKY59_15630 [Pyrinomonadaceae bacterium]|nr:hypothetical protein [Pyrinomonadaceae bacterium]
MKKYLKIFPVVLLLVFSQFVFSQGENSFASGAGGFRINLPKNDVSASELRFNDGKLSGDGNVYVWNKSPEYYHQVFYYKIYSDKQTLSVAEKKSFSDTMKDHSLKFIKDANATFQEKEYLFKGYKGFEINYLLPNAKGIIRFFIVNKRIYSFNLLFPMSYEKAEIDKIADSFTLLSGDELIAVKLAEAAPKPLPQEPVGKKERSDAQDNNLKGKVKSIVEETQDTGAKKREKSSEEYYNEAGNLLKELSYLEGYPHMITVWGYVDGDRVIRSNDIEFDEDQRTPTKILTVKAMAADYNSPLPRDERYGNKYRYKYDEQGRLIEKANYSNSGMLLFKKVNKYNGNKREVLSYNEKNELNTHYFEVLDKDGNVIEEYYLNNNGKPEDFTVYTYKFDSQGNWIYQKTDEKKVIRGKTILKPLYVSYRTITYYN